MRTLNMPAAAHWWTRLFEQNAAPPARSHPAALNPVQAAIQKYRGACPLPTDLLGPAAGTRPDSERILSLEVREPIL